MGVRRLNLVQKAINLIKINGGKEIEFSAESNQFNKNQK